MLPASITQLLLTLTFVVPGFVYQSTRITFRGRLPNDVELSTRIVRAIVTSAIFGLLYLIVAGDWLVELADQDELTNSVRLSAVAALVGGIVIPALVAVIPGLFDPGKDGPIGSLAAKLSEFPKYDPTPTAWDKVFQDRDACFVRVLNKDGRWVAGYFGSDSYATSYPEKQELFLEKQHEIDAEGVIGAEIPGSTGCIVNCEEFQLLALLEGEDPVETLGEEKP